MVPAYLAGDLDSRRRITSASEIGQVLCNLTLIIVDGVGSMHTPWNASVNSLIMRPDTPFAPMWIRARISLPRLRISRFFISYLNILDGLKMASKWPQNGLRLTT